MVPTRVNDVALKHYSCYVIIDCNKVTLRSFENITMFWNRLCYAVTRIYSNNVPDQAVFYLHIVTRRRDVLEQALLCYRDVTMF
jgi:hypothetical protein